MAAKRERPSDESEAPLSFEQALARLEGVVRVLEDGQVGLDQALAHYEDGIRLLRVCREALENVERKIMLLTGVDAEGNPIVEPFAESSGTLEEKRESRARRRSRPAAGKAAASANDFGSSGRADDQEGGGSWSDHEEPDRQRGLF